MAYFIGGLCVAAGLAAIGLIVATPTLIGAGPAGVTAVTLAGGVFTVALAAYVRD
jgi:hypothetical protein